MFNLIICGQAEATVHNEKFEDCKWLDGAKYRVTIAKAQQLALERGKGVVPNPTDQLELMNKKRNKLPRSYHGNIYHVFCMLYVTVNLLFSHWAN